jgi:prevent-host-death family protein
LNTKWRLSGDIHLFRFVKAPSKLGDRIAGARPYAPGLKSTVWGIIVHFLFQSKQIQSRPALIARLPKTSEMTGQEVGMKQWAVQDAKARFSELLETCLREGPQLVTKRGTEAAVLVPAKE